MKKYKLVDKTPYHTAGFGAMMGAAVSATSPASAIAGMALGAGVGLVGGGAVTAKNLKERKAHDALNKTQFKG